MILNDRLAARWRARSVAFFALLGVAHGAAAAEPEAPAATSDSAGRVLETVTVSSTPIEEDILPTRKSFSSVYGLDLNVLDTPRNVTVVSSAQLKQIGVQDPRDFSQLTSSSYTDSSFGSPLVPRIRGQYADLYYNGARDGFVTSGNGAPLSFNSVESVNILKGPASIAFGAGAGVGGAVDLISKYPRFNGFKGEASFDFGSDDQRIWNLDVGGPIGDRSAWRLSYTGDHSESYYDNQFRHLNAIYGAYSIRPTDRYSIDLNAEFVTGSYTENVGVNRVNQQLIDNGTYLTGLPFDQILFTFDPSAGIPVGSPGNPYDGSTSILTRTNLTGSQILNRRVTLNATPGTIGESRKFRAQAVQTWQVSDKLAIVNNTLYNLENRSKESPYYYANSFPNNWSIENRTELRFNSGRNSGNAGFSGRYSHIKAITNFNNEPAGIYDLTGDPDLWRFTEGYQPPAAILYQSATGNRLQWGVPGRQNVNNGDTNETNLSEAAVFYQHRYELTSKVALLAGARVDVIRANVSDPLGGPNYVDPLGNGIALPESSSTGWYGLKNYNISPTFKILPWLTAYATYNYSENINGGGANGGVWLYRSDNTPKERRNIFGQESKLYEIGLKASALDRKLFIGGALFKQKRGIPSGAAGQTVIQADIKGLEIEGNYQPVPNFYLTASYSYIKSELNQAQSFYNYPAEPGVNVDGAGLFAVFAPNQTFQQAGVPRQLFNLLTSYRHSSGFGASFGIQVTGAINTAASGQLDLANSLFVPDSIVANGGYFRSPRIPIQHEINGSVFYSGPSFEVRLSIDNLTDQKNWSAANPFYGNDFLIADLPIRGSLSVRYRFGERGESAR